MENAVALFGSFDGNIKLIEKEFNVRVTCRDSELKVEGDAENTSKASKISATAFRLSMKAVRTK